MRMSQVYAMLIPDWSFKDGTDAVSPNESTAHNLQLPQVNAIAGMAEPSAAGRCGWCCQRGPDLPATGTAAWLLLMCVARYHHHQDHAGVPVAGVYRCLGHARS
jgi:hypothetical protein